ncbi:MAG: hypothetical protein LBF78_10415 [Treponema sp.]|jgi:hypothetical protein|nr:hypothetical protein [Treponema sp.]
MNKGFVQRRTFLFLFFCVTLSCSGTPSWDETTAKEETEIFVLAYQTTIYNGKSQPIKTEGPVEGGAVVTYYASEAARWFSEGGTEIPPTDAGVYYVRASFPGRKDALVEYHITRALPKIIAEEKQSAAYNGDPKRVSARCDPELPLSFSYYPTPEVRQAAVKALARESEADNEESAAAFRGLRRVERAPIEQGEYYVLVYYPGDNNYLMAYKEIYFTIGPPVKRATPSPTTYPLLKKAP